MKLTDRYDGSESLFEGDRTLVWRSLPANARITKASVKLSPAQSATGELFEEIITFTNGQGDWGATKTTGTGFVEVDFHKRRTLARVMGVGAVGANLQVDVGGGVYVEINNKGAIRAPNDTLFTVPTDGKLPGLLGTKLKLTMPVTTPPTTISPDVSQVTIRCVPTNVSVRLGNLPPFWTHLGELIGEDTSPDFSAVLQAFLIEAKVQNGFYQIPLTVHSDTIARLQITLEIEYQIEASVMPQGLNEVLLPYDFGSLPKAQENVLQLAVPANMRVAPNGVTAQVRGAFEDSRIVYGPTGEVTPAGAAEVSSAISLAQMISLPETLKAIAFDFFMTVTQTAKLQLDLREDLDGKPGDVSLLPGVVKYELPAPVGTEQRSKTAGQPQWVSVVLPAEFEFQKDRRYWLVLQCLEGQTAWNATPAGAGIVGMQHTKDGGLSWRETVAAGISVPVSAFFRLRQKPERFDTPIELQVGSGEQAIRVSLDRFQPLGRVDFSLDFDEVARAFNEYLDKTSPIACPETEHLVNEDFEQWLRVGDKLMSPTPLSRLGVIPSAVAFAPDGKWAYVAGENSENSDSALVQVIDVACGEITDQDIELAAFFPNALVINPDGTRAYLAALHELLVIDLSAHQTLGDALDLSTDLSHGIEAVALSPDGGRLYVADWSSGESAPTSPSQFQGRVRAIATVALEQVIRGRLPLNKAIMATIDLMPVQVPTALTVSPNGHHLYVTISKGAGVNGLVQVFDTATIEDTVTPRPLEPSPEVGKEPSAIALTPDGKWAVVANAGSNNISLIDTLHGKVVEPPIGIGTMPTAVAISPDGSRAYVANSGSDDLSVIDLARRSVVKPAVSVNKPQTKLALTPQGDRIYVITTDGDNNSLASIQIGARLPVEWNLTAGQVTPFCLPDPFHLIAVLGGLSCLRGKGTNPSPSSLSQTVPVAESCPYEFSFYGIATDADALADVLWLGSDCGLLRTDQVPMRVQEAKQSSGILAVDANIRCFGGQDPQLVLHRERLLAPAAPNKQRFVSLRPSACVRLLN